MIAPFRFLIAIALALATGAAANAQPRLSAADIEAPAYTIVKIKANGVDPKAALEWEVTPEKFVDFATSEDETLLQFVAPPGDYIVALRVISQDPVTGKLSSKKLKATVKILPPEGEQIPPPKPPGKPPEKGQGRLDAPAAIGKISFPPYSCSATIVGPRRPDGKWDVLTAWHCIDHVGVGTKGTIKLLDGRSFPVIVSHGNRNADFCWLLLDDATVGDLPYALLAFSDPPVGTEVWHAGYGVDKPGNREEGHITGGRDSNGQLRMRLNVSSGDSGGGIFRKDTNELISCVCCTSGDRTRGQFANVWGASAVVANEARVKKTLAPPIVVEERESKPCNTNGGDRPVPMPTKTGE